MGILGMIIAVVLFLLGLAGTVLPVLPGAPLIWLGMLVYGLFTGFKTLSWLFFLGQGVAVAITLALDYLATAYGAKRYGASNAAIWGAVIGLAVGAFFGPGGIIIGPFAGAAVAEMLRGRDASHALRVGWGTLLGLIGGTALKLLIEIGMIIWFFVAAF